MIDRAINDTAVLLVLYSEQIFYVMLGLLAGGLLTRPKPHKYSIRRKL